MEQVFSDLNSLLAHSSEVPEIPSLPLANPPARGLDACAMAGDNNGETMAKR
jgi:hypothetical protein